MPDKKAPGYWNDVTNQKEFLQKLGASLEFKNYEDWYLNNYFTMINPF